MLLMMMMDASTRTHDDFTLSNSNIHHRQYQASAVDNNVISERGGDVNTISSVVLRISSLHILPVLYFEMLA